MILNDWEYQVTQKRVEGFKRALVLLNAPGNAIPDSRFPIPDSRFPTFKTELSQDSG